MRIWQNYVTYSVVLRCRLQTFTCETSHEAWPSSDWKRSCKTQFCPLRSSWFFWVDQGSTKICALCLYPMDWKRYSLVRTSILLVGRTLPCPAAWRIWNLVNVSYKISKMRVCLRTFRAWVLLLWAMPLSRVSGELIYPAIFKDYKLEAFWSVLSARPKSWL